LRTLIDAVATSPGATRRVCGSISTLSPLPPDSGRGTGPGVGRAWPRPLGPGRPGRRAGGSPAGGRSATTVSSWSHPPRPTRGSVC